MMVQEEIREALLLVQQLCTAKQIVALLRFRKEKDNVRVSAENKEQLVMRNLKDALESGAVVIDDVYDLIRTAEENGGQHVWYYRAKPNLQAVLHPDSVAERLFGTSWKKKLNEFPVLELKPQTYIISDFRASKRKPLDWFFKIYGHALLTRPTGKIEKKENGLFWREYEEVPLRSVILVRWNSPDLLEIRVQRDESRKRLDEWQAIAWKFLQDTLSKDQFAPWKLGKALNRLVLDCGKHGELYSFRDAGVMDKEQEVIAHFETVSDQGSLLKSQKTVDSLQSYVKDGGALKGLAITWLSDKTALNEEVRVLVGVRDQHEILIPAHCSAGDLDHVTDQLRRFSKTAS